MKEEQLLKKLREAFKAEAEERLKTMSSSLVELEEVSSSPDKQPPILEVISREAHSLKGASRAVNLVADDSIAPGGCQVQSAQAEVDASLETQVDEMVALLLGDKTGNG